MDMRLTRDLYLQIGMIYTTALALAMIGCAPKGAMSNYGDLNRDSVPRPDAPKQTPPPVRAPQTPAAVVPAPGTPGAPAAPATDRETLIVLHVIDDLQFPEGVLSSKRIAAKVTKPNVRYVLKAEDLPEGATIVRPTAETPGVWSLQYKPVYGTVTSGERDKQVKIKLKLEITNLNDLSSTLQSELKDLEAKLSEDAEIKVVRNGTAPEIKEIAADPTRKFVSTTQGLVYIDESSTAETRIRIIAYDPTTLGETDTRKAPKLIIGYDRPENAEYFFGDGTILIKGLNRELSENMCTRPKFEQEMTTGYDVAPMTEKDETGIGGDGYWVYTLYLDLRNRPMPVDCNVRTKIPNPSADGVWAQIKLQVKSQQNDLKSARDEAVFRINYNAKPRFTEGQGFKDKIKLSFARSVGSQQQTFTIGSLNTRGTLGIDAQAITNALKRQIPGSPTVVCEPNQSTLVCTVIWTPGCNHRQDSYTVSIPAQNAVTYAPRQFATNNGPKVVADRRTFKNDLNLELELTPQAGQCGTPMAAR